MLHVLSLVSAFLVIATGLYVLAFGNWKPFGLKFAGVTLSTLAALYMLSAQLVFGDLFQCGQMDQTACVVGGLYHLVRNIAFIAFHIATGRDAIRFNYGDRRGKRWTLTKISADS